MRYTRRAALALGGAAIHSLISPPRRWEAGHQATRLPPVVSVASEPSVGIYRGNAMHHGHQPGPVPLTAPEVLWSFGASAPLSCSPLLDIESDVVVTGGAVGAMFGIERTTGRLRWVRQIESEPRGTGFITDGRLVYIDTALHALTVADGQDVPYLVDHENLILSSLTVDDGVIYTGGRRWDHGFMDARDVATGDILWRFDLELGVEAAPIITNGIVASGSIGSALVALDAETGRAQWRLPSRGRTEAAPCTANGFMYVSTRAVSTSQATPTDLNDLAMAIDLATGSLRWQLELTAPAMTSPAILNDMVLFTGGPTMHAFDGVSGSERWRYDAEADISSSPVVVGNHLLIGSADGTLALLDATGAEVWRVGLGERVTGSPVVQGGQVYVTAGNTLHALGAPSSA